jgi:hypothetical protein
MSQDNAESFINSSPMVPKEGFEPPVKKFQKTAKLNMSFQKIVVKKPQKSINEDIAKSEATDNFKQTSSSFVYP